MTAKLGPATVLSNDDLLRRLLADYGIDAIDESVRSQSFEKHISNLESSQNEVTARTGFILKRAYDGYGLGYKVPLAILAIGKAMIGVDFAVSAPFIASNPLAFSCAAIGAVYYGYNALKDEEKEAVCEMVAQAFGYGLELISSIARFCIDLMASVFDKGMLGKLKDSLGVVASALGTSVYDITGAFRDRLAGATAATIETAGWLAEGAMEMASTVAAGVTDKGQALLGRRSGGDGSPDQRNS